MKSLLASSVTLNLGSVLRPGADFCAIEFRDWSTRVPTEYIGSHREPGTRFTRNFPVPLSLDCRKLPTLECRTS